MKGVSCESCNAFGFKLAILLTNVFFKMQSKICKPPKKHISVDAFESGCFLLTLICMKCYCMKWVPGDPLKEMINELDKMTFLRYKSN